MNPETKLLDLQDRLQLVKWRIAEERRKLGVALLAEQPQDAKHAREQLERLKVQWEDLELMVEALPHAWRPQSADFNPGVQVAKAADHAAYQTAKTRFINDYGTLMGKAEALKKRAQELLEVAAKAGPMMDRDCRTLFVTMRGSPELSEMAPLTRLADRRGKDQVNVNRRTWQRT